MQLVTYFMIYQHLRGINILCFKMESVKETVLRKEWPLSCRFYGLDFKSIYVANQCC